MAKMPGNRDWTNKDERNDRPITREQASRAGLNSGTKVDAVPQRHLMPGSKN